MGVRCRWVLYTLRLLSVTDAVVDFVLGLASRSKKDPIPTVGALDTDIILFMLCGIWFVLLLLFLFFLSLAWRKVKRTKTPLSWALITLGFIGSISYYFRVLGLDGYDWYFWGPAAAELGIVIAYVFKMAIDSSERGFLKKLFNQCWRGGADGSDGGDDDNDVPGDLLNDLGAGSPAEDV